MTTATPLRFRRFSRMVVAGLIVSVVAPAGAVLPVEYASAVTTGSACTGVTVVVDFSDFGGGVKVGCATSGFDTGSDALKSAGFTATDSQPGLVCTIDAKPDPCPTTFKGSYWSYWHGKSTDAAWTSYQVGAESSHPGAGSVEGWRYNDGTVEPSISPQDSVTRTTARSGGVTNTPVGHSSHTQAANPVAWILSGGLVVLLAAVVAVWLLRRRSARNEQ